MRSVKQMPTTVALVFFSFLSALGGIALGAYYYFVLADARIAACLVVLGLFLAVCVRAAANAGQMFFDMKGDNARLLNEMRGMLETQNRILSQLSHAVSNASRDDRELSRKLGQDIRAQVDGLAQSLRSISETSREDAALNRDRLKSDRESLAALADASDKISCDSKDINQGIQQIRNFFERIERHLDLTK
jgi:methyl-accepting chemotaxis protein